MLKKAGSMNMHGRELGLMDLVFLFVVLLFPVVLFYKITISGTKHFFLVVSD